MSIYASNAVWEKSKSTGATRLVMLCLAYHMNDEKREAWPGMATIRKETGVSKSGVERAIEWLVVNKEIEVVGGGLGRGNSYAYRFLIEVCWPEPKAKQADMPMRKGVKVTPYRVVSRVGKGVTLKRKGVKVNRKGVTLNPLPYRTIKEQEKEQKDTSPPPTDDQVLDSWQETLSTIGAFERITNRKRPHYRLVDGLPSFSSEKKRERFFEEWVTPAHDMKALANGRTDELMTAAYQELLGAGFSPGTPEGIYSTFVSLYNKAGLQPGAKKPVQDLSWLDSIPTFDD